MNYIFFGTPEFAAIILGKLITAGFIPEAVVCNPDKPVGRKKIITPPPAKIVMRNEKLEMRVVQPENFSSSLISHLSSLNPDFFVIAAYSKILPKGILEIPRLGAIGVHPSLLPKYRGPSPIQTAILNGDEITGVTLYLMDDKIDHGAIIANSEFRMQNAEWNYESLMRKLAELGADLLIEFLRKQNQYLGSPTSQKLRNIKEVGLPEIELRPQDESQASYTKKFKTEDAFIEPQDLEKAQNISASSPQVAAEIDRKIRALNPEPGTFTLSPSKGGLSKRMKILEAELTPEGKLKLKKIQFESKKPVEI